MSEKAAALGLTYTAVLADELGAVTGEDLVLGEVAHLSFDHHSSTEIEERGNKKCKEVK